MKRAYRIDFCNKFVCALNIYLIMQWLKTALTNWNQKHQIEKKLV